jgi:hypothetical protein
MTTTRIDEIADGIYRISTLVADIGPDGFSFNQFLIDAEEPLLFHTGHRSMFASVADAVATIVALDRMRWIAFGHVESDECGSMNQFLAVSPRAQVAHGALGCQVSLDEMADRPPRSLADGEVLASAASGSAISTPPTSPTAGRHESSSRRRPKRCSAVTCSPTWAADRLWSRPTSSERHRQLRTVSAPPASRRTPPRPSGASPSSPPAPSRSCTARRSPETQRASCERSPTTTTGVSPRAAPEPTVPAVPTGSCRPPWAGGSGTVEGSPAPLDMTCRPYRPTAGSTFCGFDVLGGQRFLVASTGSKGSGIARFDPPRTCDHRGALSRAGAWRCIRARAMQWLVHPHLEQRRCSVSAHTRALAPCLRSVRRS